MCTEANVVIGDQMIECETVGQLAAALGVQPVVVSNDPEDCCLCNAHWESLGARRATDAEGWPFPEYIIERPNAE
jgi:hypothetical protein